MKTITYTVTDENGIHARPAGLIVQTAKRFQSSLSITLSGKSGEQKTADAKKLFAVMGLGALKGDVLTISAVGEDAERAILGLEEAMRTAGL